GHCCGAARRPCWEGGESVRRGCAGESCPRDIGHAECVVRVERRSVVCRAALRSLPLVEVGNVRRRRGCGDPFQDAEFPAGREGGESTRLRPRWAARHRSECAEAETTRCQGEEEREAAKGSFHGLSIGRWSTSA